jgi:hypothetical protein
VEHRVADRIVSFLDLWGNRRTAQPNQVISNVHPEELAKLQESGQVISTPDEVDEENAREDARIAANEATAGNAPPPPPPASLGGKSDSDPSTSSTSGKA